MATKKTTAAKKAAGPKKASKTAALTAWVLEKHRTDGSFKMADALALVGWAECLRTLRKQVAEHRFRVVKLKDDDDTYALKRAATQKRAVRKSKNKS